ncbi:MAG: MFS transporter [Pseudomonadales bacterium]|nr:MFS transporter [Pseudomonadales bacterium]
MQTRIISEAERTRLKGNVSKTLLLGFCGVFLVIMPILVPFFETRGLDIQDVFLLQAVFAAVILVMEIPSGYLADVLGRKRTLVVGALFLGVGHSLLLVADSFTSLMLFEIGLGIGVSLVSGSDLALLYDSEIALGRSARRQRKVVGRLYTVHTASEAVASIVCSIILLFWSFDAAIYVQVTVGWMPFLISLTLVEPPVERLVASGHVQNFGVILRRLLLGDALLRQVFLSLCIWSLTTFYAVWILQRLWLDQGVPVQNFGYLWGLLMLIAAIAGRYAHAVEDRLGAEALLVLIGVLPVLGYIGLAGFSVLGGFVAAILFFVSRGFGLVVLREALNRRVESKYRATANSLASFGFRGSFVITGPIVGYSMDAWGLQSTLWMLAFGSLLIFAVLILPLILSVKKLPEVGNETLVVAGE